MARDITRGLAPAGRMADMDSVLEIKMFEHGTGIGGVVVHVVTVVHLGRATVTPTVMSDSAIAFAEEVKHLVVPVV